MDKYKERILLAAIWYQDIELKKDIPQLRPKNIDHGIVITGYRHGHCIWTISALLGLRTCEFGEDCAGKTKQGFLTSHNRFVERKEARETHLSNGGSADFEELYSEDLY